MLYKDLIKFGIIQRDDGARSKSADSQTLSLVYKHDNRPLKKMVYMIKFRSDSIFSSDNKIVYLTKDIVMPEIYRHARNTDYQATPPVCYLETLFILQ